jgi:isoleucyl-tRNA synthetase
MMQVSTLKTHQAFGHDAEGGAARVIDDKGKKGDANKRVIAALIEHDKLFARGRLKHTYPHSWRSKKPVIFRNTPQWFVSMDEAIEGKQGDTLRKRALNAIDATTFYPPAGQNRLRGMIEGRPDWVLSRQRAWGVPITVFTHKETGEVLRDRRSISALSKRSMPKVRMPGLSTMPKRGSWATPTMPTTMNR